MLFLLALLVDEAQAAISTDAVGQVHDEIAFAEIEKRVDRLTEATARQAAQLAAMEELAGRENKRAGFLTPKSKAGLKRAYGEVEATRAGQFSQREDFSQTLDLSLGGRDDEHIVAVGNRIQLVADAANIAAEAFDRFERQMAMQAGRASLNFGGGCDGETAALGEYGRNRVKASRFLDA